MSTPQKLWCYTQIPQFQTCPGTSSTPAPCHRWEHPLHWRWWRAPPKWNAPAVPGNPPAWLCWLSWNIGTPSHHPFLDGIFSNENHPAIRVPPWLWKPSLGLLQLMVGLPYYPIEEGLVSDPICSGWKKWVQDTKYSSCRPSPFCSLYFRTLLSALHHSCCIFLNPNHVESSKRQFPQMINCLVWPLKKKNTFFFQGDVTQIINNILVWMVLNN